MMARPGFLTIGLSPRFIARGLVGLLLGLFLVPADLGQGLFSIPEALGAESVGVAPLGAIATPASKEGKWRITLSGNQTIAEAKLLAAAREELAQFAAQGHRASAIDDAAFQMELLYRHAGYPQAIVDYEVDAEARQALFRVQEGQRVMVRELLVQGNLGLARPRLLALAPAIRASLDHHELFPYVAETLDDLVEDIRSLYLSEGYLQVEARALAPSLPLAGREESVVVTITIREGVRFTVGGVEVGGDRPPELSRAIADIVKTMQGAVYQPRQKLLLRTKLRDAYENGGYAEVAITVDEVLDEKRGLARLVATVVSGQRVVVDEIRISGNERTSPDFIRSRLRFEPGALYTLDDKREGFSSLYRTGLFADVELSLAAGPHPGRKKVEVKITERKAREVYVEPGWGSYELLRFKSGYKDTNLFGTGRILRFDSQLSVMGRSLEAGVSDPWFLGSEWTVSLPFHYRYRTEPAFTLENSGADILALRTIHKKVTLNLGYQYSKNVVSDVGPAADLQGVGTNFNNASISCQLTRDTRDDMFFPASGYRGNVSLALARPEFGGTISYNRLLTGVRYFYPLANGSIIGLRFNTGVILPTGGEESIPVSGRFFNGGDSSVRSFQASKIGPRDTNGDPLGGTAFSTYSVEWRRKLTADFAWSLFVDLGNVSPNRTTVAGQSPLLLDSATLIQATWQDYFSDLRSGVGTGVQYMLPVGPARLDLAVNPDRKPERGEPDYTVHFSIGMAF